MSLFSYFLAEFDEVCVYAVDEGGRTGYQSSDSGHCNSIRLRLEPSGEADRLNFILNRIYIMKRVNGYETRVDIVSVNRRPILSI